MCIRYPCSVVVSTSAGDGRERSNRSADIPFSSKNGELCLTVGKTTLCGGVNR